MKNEKKQLIDIAQKVHTHKNLSPDEITVLLSFEKKEESHTVTKVLSAVALPASIIIGMSFVIYSDFFDGMTQALPSWTNLSPSLLAGIDYLWDFIGEPIGKANILFHLPNVVLYTFGITGIKSLIDSIERRSWLDKVLIAQKNLQNQIDQGKIHVAMKKGHSLLFVGKGDFIGMQFSLNHEPNETITISQLKPDYTRIWNYYDVATLYENLKDVIKRSDGEHAGEYIFFPVKDDQIFLPGETAYDLSPHKLDIICQDIRTLEKENKWKPLQIIIIGDTFHRSFVQSEDENGVIRKSEDIISLASISKKYSHVTLLDPSDIVIKRIIEIAKGRKIVFRATKDGIKEYKKRFYDRLNELGYTQLTKEKGILTIGYDIFEDQTEQQTLSRKIDDYFPVVLSKNVRDALIRNGYKKSEFLYVPDLVLKTLTKKAHEQ